MNITKSSYNNEIRIIFNPSVNEPTRIFGEKFVSNNLNKCKIKVNDNWYKLSSYFSLKNTNEIKLCGINEITDMSYMFYYCNTLKSLPDFDKIDTSKVNNIEFLFSKCESLESLPDLSKWNTSNIISMRNLF